MKIIVEMKIPSWNITSNQHWAVRAKTRKVWWGLIMEQLPAGNKKNINKKMLVKIISYRKRLIDQDNLYVKQLLDSLKDCGLIVDDSVCWLHLEKIEQIKSKEEKTEIILQEI